jgi:subtilisin family serine protease
MIRGLILLLLFILSGAVNVQASPLPEAVAASDDIPSARQILVLTKLDAGHFRLNSGYDGGYGSAQARSARQFLARRIARDHGLKLVDAWPMPLIELNCFIMAVPDGRSVTDVAKEVSKDPAVEFVEPMHIYEAKGLPLAYNDPLFAAQPDARLWRLADLHQISTGKGVTVAVIDSGIEATHPDLIGQVSVSRNFVAGRPPVAERHGTGVAGIIAAKAGNGVGIVGVAPDARLMALRACWQQSSQSAASYCDSLSLAKALHFAIEGGAQVINMSLAGPPDALLSRLLDVAMKRDMAIVAAFDKNQADGGFPASKPGVIAVSDEALAVRARRVYTAPGRDVPTTQPGGKWNLVNGSSYSAAHVSGLVALQRAKMIGKHGGATLIAARADGGALDACASLLLAVGHCNCACARSARVVAEAPH